MLLSENKKKKKDGVNGEEANHVWKYGLFFVLSEVDYDLRKQ